MQVVVYFKNCDCFKYIKNTPTCFGSLRIHHQGVIKQYLTKNTYNCSTVQVTHCQCSAAYLTCTVCVYCTGWRCIIKNALWDPQRVSIRDPTMHKRWGSHSAFLRIHLQPVHYTHTVQVKYAAQH
jgi:hypothetical protein